jgi:uncharacterized protein (TIGR02118 family)
MKAKSMIKYTVMYPMTPGTRFDLDYYVNKHVPLLMSVAGDACRGYQVSKGVSAGSPGSSPLYGVMIDVYFDSVEAFEKAIPPHAARLKADIPNFTDIVPVRQINEVVAATTM